MASRGSASGLGAVLTNLRRAAYRASCVDVAAGERAVELMRDAVASTRRGDAGGGHGGTRMKEARRTGRGPCVLGRRSGLWVAVRGAGGYFFLHSGPSWGEPFSVMPPPDAFSSADFSAFIGVKLAHWAGTLASAKMASTGHSGTQASQSMQSAGRRFFCPRWCWGFHG